MIDTNEHDHSWIRPLDEYQSYRGLPPMAGLCSVAEAAKPGLSVDQCVGRLKRYHYALKRLHEILTARITTEPVYELKTAFSHHAYLCAEHVAAIRKRVGEMREPPLGLEEVPHPALEVLFDEIRAAPSTAELLLGIYECAIPALIEALGRHTIDTNRLIDAPSVRVCRFALLELGDMRDFGRKAVAAMVEPSQLAAADDWLALLDRLFAAAGGLHGADTVDDRPIERRYSATPYVYDRVPKRDERFYDGYNGGVNPEAFLYDEHYPAQAKTLMMFYKRLREIDVPEMMASIIAETPGKPWDYYLEMTRQLWDEARHAMIGEVGFASLGIDWSRIPVNFTWSLNLNTQLTPIERHAVLFFIEQGLMPKTGKRFEWEVGRASGNPLSATAQDYDWADEVLHAAIGRRWYVAQFGNLHEALDYGDRCWTKVVSDWRGYRERGLTDHRNWWPELYSAACERWGIVPDPQVLQFAETYESQRADLQALPAE
ncbi:MAG TPA: hypothetical protein VHZ24_21490 [Pirellulales bacterium]|jgi:hypothetical protein|nr:hypothetical protein [Pirellulales bacterium]